MGFIDSASGNSIWRGVDYYNEKKVASYVKADDLVYDGIVKGSYNNQYNVHIEINHPRRSSCNCAFATDRRVICKHMIALYFTAVPKAYKDFMKEVEEYEKEEKLKEEQHYQELRKYVMSLSKAELQEKYLSTLIQLEEEDEYRRQYWR